MTAGMWACGEPFSAPSSSGNGGSGGDNSGAGAGGQTASSGTGLSEQDCDAGDFAKDPLFYSTLNDMDAILLPETGQAGLGIGQQLEFVPTPHEYGVVLASDGAAFSYQTAGGRGTRVIDPRHATIDFCFKPDHDSNDNRRHNFFMLDHELETPVRFFKREAGNRLVLSLWGQDAAITEDPGYQKDEWIRITVAWSSSPTDGTEADIFVNGYEMNIAPSDIVAEPLPAPNPSIRLRFGNLVAEGDDSPGGVLDELYIYEGKLNPDS